MIIEIVYSDERQVVNEITSLEIITKENKENHFISFKDKEGDWYSVKFEEFKKCILVYGNGNCRVVEGYKKQNGMNQNDRSRTL